MTLKINEIKEILLNSAYTELPEKINMFKDDERAGVIKLIAQ